MRNLFRALIRADGEGLFGRALSAGFWAAALRISLRIAIIIRTVILARLLTPDDFGLMAIATISIMFLERFTESGFDSALVQRDDDIRPYLNSAWTMQIVRGLTIAALLMVGAPWIAAFFDAPDATAVIQALAVTVVIGGFVNIAVVTFVKELRFDKYFALQMALKGTDVVVSIIAAFALRSVWALVIGALAGEVARLIVSYLINDYRPRFRWVWEQVKSLFHFGKWITASQIINFIVGEIDDILVGRILGVRSLGWYRMAFNFSQSVATEITSVTSQVAFPTYSKMQGDLKRLRAAFMGTVHLVAFLGFPLGIGTILVADDLVFGLLGDQWSPVVTPLRLLSIAGLVRGLSATIGPLMQSQGRPDIPPRFGVAKLAVLAILLVPMINASGIDGAAAAVTIAGLSSGVPALIYSLRKVRATAPQIWQAIGVPAINTAIMAGIVAMTEYLFFDAPSVGSFLALIAVGVLGYVAAVGATTAIGLYQAPKDLTQQIRRVVS